MIGKSISTKLAEIEDTLIDFELNEGQVPNFTDEGFRAAIKIFMSVIMEKIWVLQEHEIIDFEDRVNMATSAGNEMRKFVKTYTNIDTHDLYK